MFKYERIITDEEQKILENDLIDIKDWIDKAIEGKIHNCLKRAANQYNQLARAERLETVPTTEDAKAKEFFRHPNYKNRLQREQELKDK